MEHGGPTRPEAIAGLSDLLVGSLAVALVAWRRPHRRVMVLGGLLAVLVDLVKYLPVVGPRLARTPSLHSFVLFHHGIQHNVAPAQWPLGFGTQVVVVGLALAVCLRRPRAG